MMDSIEKDSFWRRGSEGIGVYVVSSAASKFLQRSAAGGPGGGGKGIGTAIPLSNSASAKARRLRTRSLQTGSFVNSLSLPSNDHKYHLI